MCAQTAEVCAENKIGDTCRRCLNPILKKLHKQDTDLLQLQEEEGLAGNKIRKEKVEDNEAKGLIILKRNNKMGLGNRLGNKENQGS